MSQPAIIKIKIRTGTSTEWLNANPILLQGEFGYVSDWGVIVIGNGAYDATTLLDTVGQTNQYYNAASFNSITGALQNAIGNETGARELADADLQNNIDAIGLDVTNINSNINGLQTDVATLQSLINLFDLTTLTAKGQILILDEVTGLYSPLQVGADGKVLTADSTQSNGVAWSDIPTQSLNDLTDVNAPTPNTNDLLSFDGTDWINVAPPTIPSTLNDLSDVNVAPSNNDVLVYDATHSEWINAQPTIPALDDLTDVDVATATTNDLLHFDGSMWVNIAPTTYGDMYKSTYDTNNDGIVDVADISNSAKQMLTIGRNATGSTLSKGIIVYISGSTGNRPNFVKARANVESTSAGTFGVVTADIANNDDGYVCTLGTLDNLDTRSTATNPFTSDTLADGDTIYLSPTTAGYITNVKPAAPNHLVYVGKVIRTSPTQGTIVYRIQNGYELAELHDVQASVPTNNDVLYYDSSVAQWKTNSIASVLGYTPANNSTSVQTSRSIATTSPLTGGGNLSADRTLAINQATTSQDGYLSSTNWNTFNNKLIGFGQYRKSGRWYATTFTNLGTATITNAANTIRYVPFIIDQDITISRIGINVNTGGGVGTTCRIGIYTNDATTCQPSTLLVDSGPLALDGGAGQRSIANLSISLTKGLYWFAYFGNATTGTLIATPVSAMVDVKGLSAIQNYPVYALAQSLTYTSLPATASPTTEVSGANGYVFYYYY